MIYDNQTRSMLQTDSGRRHRQHPDGVKKNADGAGDVWFGPKVPLGKEGNWIQTMPGKGWKTCSCGCTARCSPGSTRAGGRAKSRR